jgi:hypothetical protein
VVSVEEAERTALDGIDFDGLISDEETGLSTVLGRHVVEVDNEGDVGHFARASREAAIVMRCKFLARLICKIAKERERERETG